MPTRTLVTAIYRPNGSGPFPLIMFSHGLAGHPEKFTKLLSAWADAGFAVVAPTFPLTNSHVKNAYGESGDAVNQATDVTFVLDHVLALNRDPTESAVRRDRYRPHRRGRAVARRVHHLRVALRRVLP